MAQSASLGAPAPVLAIVDGIPTTTSVDVARYFGKRHDHVLRDIRALVENPLVPLPIFGEMSYEVEVANGAKVKQPAYRITRDGFTLLAMGFTGKRALQFKLAYIGAFNKMEAELRKPQARARKPLAHPRPTSIPPEVQPLLDAAVWRIVGRAHADIYDWAQRELAYGCNLTHPSNADTRPKRAQDKLDTLTYEDWITQGEASVCSGMLVFFEVAQDVAAKAMARIQPIVPYASGMGNAKKVGA